MSTLYKISQLLFRNIGLFSLLIGISFVIFGIINFNSLPYYYFSLSGSPGFDGQITIIVNSVLWLALCGFLIFIGIEFLFSAKAFSQNKLNDQDPIALKFFLISIIVIAGLITYIILLLLNVLAPIQFFPNVLFIDDETLMDFSPIFNTLFLYLLLTIPYRVGYKLIKYGFKIGGIN